MGAECSAERNDNLDIDYKLGKFGNIKKNNSQSSIDNPKIFSLECKSYKDYNYKIEMIKVKIKEIIKKIEITNDYYPIKKYSFIKIFRPQNTLGKIENSYHSNMEIVRPEKLFEVILILFYFKIALIIFQKISSVYGNSFNFPKQELSKIDYNLISRYLAYEIDEDDDSGNITKKIIKRINFFSEEFPFKLSKIEKIITSKKIYVFGYDIYNRITFYIKPYLNGLFSLEKIDYIIYIFFIIEHLIPTIKEKYNFSDQINIILDFNNNDADTELIRFIMYYFNCYYPLILGKIHIINFQFEALKRNLSFKNELGDLDFFRNIIFHNETYQLHIIKDFYPNCLPIEYGGYHLADGYKIKKDFNLDDFIEYTLSMILINEI